MKVALDLLTVNNLVLTKDEAHYEFAKVWEWKMRHIQTNMDPKNFLNESIKCFFRKYCSKCTMIFANNFIDEATSFFRTSTNSSSPSTTDLIKKWNATIHSHVINLAGRCVIETNSISLPIPDLSMIRHYIFIDTSELMSPSSRSGADPRIAIRCRIFQELIDTPLKQSNGLRMHQLLNKMCNRLLTIVGRAPSVSTNDDVLYEEIIGYINRTIDEVNHELNICQLELSTDFAYIMHSNAILLLIFSYHQNQEREFKRQLEDLQRKRSSLQKSFIRKMTSKAL